ncbi:carboxymuconolactone decarboxylase family protein [Nocardia sp. NEAU-G5]|uniref:Carboxymuconolactone decarboxylase family protein n=1 Tax=Nocardia albiluteola TaxID=2842303 RepID=A0ABS6BBV0_9NOCA|nr:carboxymuconolactone decarboxylase family protein [Nocardia albiluteola]MBU3067758.1 carboxymuconolactone decarboxylase family protein [Nocardia albiluteola]
MTIDNTPSLADELAGKIDVPPTSSGVLDTKLVELIRFAIDVSATHLYTPGIRRHIRRALELGATRDELLEVIELSSVIGINACATSTPILADELDRKGKRGEPATPAHPTPTCDRLRDRGEFNPRWESMYELVPDLLETFLEIKVALSRDGVLPALWIELLSVAGNAALTHMYEPGTRRHIQAALELGATREQVLEVLTIVAQQGNEVYESALPILDDESENLRGH